MSDRDLIIGLLKRVERRKRANRIFRSVAAGVCISLLVPITFKLIDLFNPFRGRTVVFVLATWGVLSIAYFIWRLRGRETLEDVAARLDHQAELHDQIKTAYWFIRHPAESPWVDAQIRRAARDS